MAGDAPIFLSWYFERKKYSDNFCIDRQHYGRMACMRHHRVYRILCIAVCAPAGYGTYQFFALLFYIISDGYCFRKRRNDRCYLYDLGKQHAYSRYLCRRRRYFGHIFRGSLLADVLRRSFDQQINKYQYLREYQNNVKNSVCALYCNGCVVRRHRFYHHSRRGHRCYQYDRQCQYGKRDALSYLCRLL